jgi:hypothetical protein
MRKFALLALLSGCFAVSNAPTPKACPPGQASRFDGSAWQCEAPPAVCQGGFPVWSGAAWTCGAFPFTTATVPECTGGFPAWSTTGWVCTVPAPPTCPGGYPYWTGAAWACGVLPPDLSSALASPGSLASYFSSADGGLSSPDAGVPGVALSLYGTLFNAPTATSGSATDMGCLTVTHNWNTPAVGYSAWYSATPSAGATDGGTGGAGDAGPEVWIPVPTQANVGTEDIAFEQPVTASPASFIYNSLVYLDDNNAATATGYAAPASLGLVLTGALTVNLGVSYPLSAVSVVVDLSLYPTGTGTESWSLSLGDSPNAPGLTIATGSCTPGNVCQVNQELPQPLAGQFLTWNCISAFTDGSTDYCLVNEVQAYPVGGYFVSEPDTNSVRVCNYSGTPRDMALRVVR